MSNSNVKNETLKRTKILLITYLVILLLATILFVFIVVSNNFFWLFGIVFFIPFYYSVFKKHSLYKIMKNLMKLQEQWGEGVKRKRDFDKINLLFTMLNNKGVGLAKNANTAIDNQTWQDLNLNHVYSSLDSTLTSPGENILYNILRNPLFDTLELSNRNEIITEFQKNKGFRENIGLELLKLGRQKDNSLVELLWSEIPEPAPYSFVFNFLAICSLLIIPSFYYLGFISVIFLAMMMGINMWISHYVKKKYFNQLPIVAIKYLSALINTADKISSIDNSVIKDYQNDLKQLVEKTSKLSKKINIIIPNDNVKSDMELVYDYLNNLFLIELRSFNSSLYEINKHIKELQKIYKILGKLDSLLSIASYRESLEYYCLPLLNNKTKNSKVKIEDVYHPLLKDPISNSIQLNNQGVIITGSNMAGKSTFLRTIGINVLMAQTISTCLASSYEGSMLKVVSSISRTDNIMAGKSFYFAEAERLLKLINTARDDIPALCIIDELLSGTNSVERLYAAQEILTYLYKNNVLTMVATHDLDLADRLSDKYQCYHFTDNVTKNGLDFDYTLKKGIAVTANAVKLLQYLNYPTEITDKALKYVE